jgi:4'-phosphopantetheinyl transferase EntD
MHASHNNSLRSAIHSLAIPNIIVGHRAISPGDETTLMPEEAYAFSSSALVVRQASGAGRMVARDLLASLGFLGCAIPKATSGAPIWPAVVVGSISHDSDFAVAAVALNEHVSALGIDIEPAEYLPTDLLDLVVTERELARISDDPYRGRLLFAAKEAAYKAVFPLTNLFLDHHDVEIDLKKCMALIRQQWRLELRYCISSHLIVLAYIRTSTDQT